MTNSGPILLISNSTCHRQGYLEHVATDIAEVTGRSRHVAFVPFAANDRGAYVTQARERFAAFGCTLASVHDTSNPRRLVEQSDAIFVGGGNTFRLLTALYHSGLLEPIRERVRAGASYIGSSAGSIVAGPSLRTTKDMPIVQPPSFEALGIVDFHISPHFLDPDPSSTHMGETQEERILQFLAENDGAVVGLREGSWLWCQSRAVILKGAPGARLFRRDMPPVEVRDGQDIGSLVSEAVEVHA